MQHWNELRTAYLVAQTGTIRAAADALGVHRATVVRHVDTLESALGARFFHRLRSGYALTEAGEDLLEVASIADEQFREFAGRTRGRTTELSGELRVTSISLLAPLMLEAIRRYRSAHPQVSVHFEVETRVLRLDHGEAHVALRAGASPDHPDAIVARLPKLLTALYAHPAYIERHGMPVTEADLHRHAFVREPNQLTAMSAFWDQLPAGAVALYCSDLQTALQAIASGQGIGFYPVFLAKQHGLVEVRPSSPAWDVSLWAVSHMGLRRTAKVRSMVRALRETADELLPRPAPPGRSNPDPSR